MRRYKKNEVPRGISSNATTQKSGYGASTPAHWIVLEGKTLPYTFGPQDRKASIASRNAQFEDSELSDLSELSKQAPRRHPILGPRNRMKLAQNAQLSNVDILRESPSRPRGLCDKCFELDLWRFKKEGAFVPHHDSFRSLAASARTCILCYLFLREAPKPTTQVPFTYDGARALLLTATRQRYELLTKGLQLDKFVIHFPVIRPGGPANVSVQVKQQLIAGRDSQAALTGDVIGRRVHGGTNILCVINWIAECCKTHKNCQRGLNRVRFADLGDINSVPPRLIDVGTSDNTVLRLIEADHTFSKPYLALSYTKGVAKVQSTNKANLEKRKVKFKLDLMNRTFKQAILLTRQLGFRYLWIDALCIVMDSSSDRGKHVPRMGIIFQNATLTLAADCSSTADEGLIVADHAVRKEARLPYRAEDGTALGHYYVSGSKPKSFDESIAKGPLSQRAWCTQARVLSRRILHFGHDQLFWECDSGIWSEESIMPLDTLPRADALGHWRKDFTTFKRKMTMQSYATSKEALAIYKLWYSVVEHYSPRSLPREADKSSAIAGLAYVFACLMPKRDTYIAGLWQRDLPFGLLWSPGSFHKWRIKFCRTPTLPRAPSWSWISVEGPIAWPDGFITQYHAQVLDIGSYFDADSDLEFATLRIRGKLAILSTLYGFRPQDAQWKRTARQAALQASTTVVGTIEGTADTGETDVDGGPIRLPCALFDTASITKTWNILHNPLYDAGHDEHSFRARQKLKAKAKKDFIAILMASSGCQTANCRRHSGGNCGCGLGYALILWPTDGEDSVGRRGSGKGHGLMFRRVGIAQVRVADFATEVAREREVIIV